MTTDPFHDRVSDWLYGDELNDHRALLADIDRDIVAATFTVRCPYHGDWQKVPLDLNDDCPACIERDDRHAAADALDDYRRGGALINRHDHDYTDY